MAWTKFIDAPCSVRCKATIRLKDGTTAQCGRKGPINGLCRQHESIRKNGKPCPQPGGGRGECGDGGVSAECGV